MKICPTCTKSYPDDANFCPEEGCATADGPSRLVEQQAPPPAAAQPPMAAAPMAAAPMAPASVGVNPVAQRFQPTAQLGGGTTGEVWLARDAQTGADVAYKLIGPDVLANAGAVARAEREFKQLTRVASPRLAAIVDCDKTADGRLWVAMEYCDGAESLDRVLRRGPVPLDRAKVIVAQIGHALLEAQKAGLVHRDLAPKNVLLTPSGEVKVINFPIAKPISDRVAGTPAYLSPEQAQGKTADQRSNTYSLACILYHLITGEPPFSAPTPQGLLELHVSSPPLAPSQRRTDAGLSPEVDKLIQKALDKSSSRRHLTLRLFLTEVESLSTAAPAATPAAAARDVGFAKTMLFAGGQADVQKMVANAIAARAAGRAPTPSPAGPAAPANSGFAAAPSVQTAPPPAQAPAPMAAAPVAAEMSPPSRLTPAPVTPTNRPLTPAGGSGAVAAGDMGKMSATKNNAAFRETLWFKKGDVEQMVADAKAKMAAGVPKPEAIVPDDVLPVEDRYVDDGTVTTDDRKKFSLRTGGTATSMPTLAREIPGEKMSASEMVEELGGGGRRKSVMVAAVAVVAVVIAAVYFVMRGPETPPAPKPAPVAPAAMVPPPPPAGAPPKPEPAKEIAKPAEPVKTAEARPEPPTRKAVHPVRSKKPEKKRR